MDAPVESAGRFDADAAFAFLVAMGDRYACKRFDPTLPLPAEAEAYILECGRLSPSSFGLEPWTFRVFRGGPRSREFSDVCLGQEAALTSPFAVVVTTRKPEAFDPDSGFVRARSERFPGGHPVFKADYEGYYRFLEREGRLPHWSRAQAYIAGANMMTGAAAAGIDSCPIEGYDEEKLAAFLGPDAADEAPGLVLLFGYRAEDERPKIRETLESIVRVV